MKQHWDIFCAIVDNFGDIGFCWRLARQLVNERGLKVRLWVDDLAILSKILPAISSNKIQQWFQGVEVCSWQQPFPTIIPAEVVIEAFACKLPENYIQAMADLPKQPVWINLEYLSAENWILDCHLLPSLHPSLPLTKYFFFPGFIEGTGGLLLEDNLLSNRNAFIKNLKEAYWQEMGIQLCREKELLISLFCYDDAPIKELFSSWVISEVPILVLVPQHSIENSIGSFFGVGTPKIGQKLQLGQLHVCVIPFQDQEKYDQLLWACDINFVRGEDSFVRAQWAAQPFIWNIYPQAKQLHQIKLEAFLNIYTKDMPPEMLSTVFSMWKAWNGIGQIKDAWPPFSLQIAALKQYGEKWIRELLPIKNLASNLVQFSKKDQI